MAKYEYTSLSEALEAIKPGMKVSVWTNDAQRKGEPVIKGVVGFVGSLDGFYLWNDTHQGSRWDNEYEKTHKYSWHVTRSNFIKLTINKNKTFMSKVSTMMKKLLDADTQALVKAGFVNGDLELTSEGTKQLQTILFVANKAALVEAAEEVIAEEEKADK